MDSDRTACDLLFMEKRLMKAQEINLENYLGLWYEQARLPNFFERRCVCGITAQYTLLPDGSIEVLNSCIKSNGKKISSRGLARPGKTSDVTFEVTFAPSFLRSFPFVWADYTVIFVDKEYSVALVGEPKKRFLWVLSREKRVDSSTLNQLLSKAQTLGYKLDSLIHVSN